MRAKVKFKTLKWEIQLGKLKEQEQKKKKFFRLSVEYSNSNSQLTILCQGKKKNRGQRQTTNWEECVRMEDRRRRRKKKTFFISSLIYVPPCFIAYHRERRDENSQRESSVCVCVCLCVCVCVDGKKLNIELDKACETWTVCLPHDFYCIVPLRHNPHNTDSIRSKEDVEAIYRYICCPLSTHFHGCDIAIILLIQSLFQKFLSSTSVPSQNMEKFFHKEDCKYLWKGFFSFFWNVLWWFFMDNPSYFMYFFRN